MVEPASNSHTIVSMMHNEKLRQCSGCKNNDPAFLYCLKGCGVEVAINQPVYYCYNKNNCKCSLMKSKDIFFCQPEYEYQREYCIDCSEKYHSDHGSVRILVLVDDIVRNHWSLLFEKV